MHFNQKSYYKYKTSQSGQKYKFHYICIGLAAIVSHCFVNFRLVEDYMQDETSIIHVLEEPEYYINSDNNSTSGHGMRKTKATESLFFGSCSTTAESL